MPYIKQEDRKKLEEGNNQNPETVGELNYLISKLCNSYIKYNGKSYRTYNSVIGVLECAKLELYRRQIQIFEDQKIIENGDL